MKSLISFGFIAAAVLGFSAVSSEARAEDVQKNCKIQGGAGANLRGTKDKATYEECKKSCADTADNPNRSCTWGSVTIRKTPRGKCVIKGGNTGKVLDPNLDLMETLKCRQQCDKYASSHPKRTCVWEPRGSTGFMDTLEPIVIK